MNKMLCTVWRRKLYVLLSKSPKRSKVPYFRLFEANIQQRKLFCLSQGYQLHGTDYRGLVSSYKIEYSYDGNYWIAYVDSTKNSTSQGYRVSGFVSVNKLVRLDSSDSWSHWPL